MKVPSMANAISAEGKCLTNFRVLGVDLLCLLKKGHSGVHEAGGYCGDHGEYIGRLVCPYHDDRGFTCKATANPSVVVPGYFPVEEPGDSHTSPEVEKVFVDVAKCGKPLPGGVPRMGMYRACVLDKGHEGLCAPGGDCYIHGKYVGEECPHWPECSSARITKASQGYREAHKLSEFREELRKDGYDNASLDAIMDRITALEEYILLQGGLNNADASPSVLTPLGDRMRRRIEDLESIIVDIIVGRSRRGSRTIAQRAGLKWDPLQLKYVPINPL